jgi:hypothetical protein
VHLEIRDGTDGRRIALGGRWTVENVAALERAVAAGPGGPGPAARPGAPRNPGPPGEGQARGGGGP